MSLLRIRTYSLRARLMLLVLLLLVFATSVPGFLLLMQHRSSVHAGQVTSQASHAVLATVEARELLRNIHKDILRGQLNPQDIDDLKALLRDHPQSMAEGSPSDYVADYLDLIDSGDGRSRSRLLSAYTSVVSKLDAIIETEKLKASSTAQEQLARQQEIFRTGLLVLLLVAVAFLILSYKAISVVTAPVHSLIGFLDEVNLEEALLPASAVLGPASSESSESGMPEVSRLVQAFGRFYEKIRGYRALNIRRLLVEKHRANIIAASILDGVFLLRGEEIVYVNPVGEKILGVPDGTLEGLRQANPAAKRAILSAVSRTLPVEFSLKVEDRIFHYLLQARPVLEPELADEVLSLAGEIGELSSVEPQSGEGTFDSIRATTLVVAQDVTLVRESQEAKGHFLATLSHEIKTPVTSLTMATRLLRKSVDQLPNPSHQSLIVTCAEDVDRLRGLLGDLLSISSFDTLTQRLEIQSVDLGRLVKQSVQSFRPDAKERGVDLTCEVFLSDGKPIIAPVDPTKIAWAVSNLLTNGLRHTPKGGKVVMKVQVVDGRAEVRVRDTGPGIDRKRQSQIFEKFNSHYDIRVGRSGGAGVGLAIAREIVVAHQGRIWVSSEPGQGAEFGFTIPLSRRFGDSLNGDGARGAHLSESASPVSRGGDVEGRGASLHANGHVSGPACSVKKLKGALSGASFGS